MASKVIEMLSGGEEDMNKKELLLESKAELIERAREIDLTGRTKMAKEELAGEIAKVMSRIEAARARRVRMVAKPVSSSRRATSAKARHAIEERSRKRREKSAEDEKVKSKPALAKSSASAGIRPSRAVKKKGLPPGLESLDLDAGSSTSVVHPSAVEKKPEAYVSLVSEDRLSGGPLPKKYGKNKFVILTRDPRWLFAYWELLPVTEGKVIRDAGDDLAGESVRRVLRVFDMLGEKSEDDEFVGSFDVMIHPGASSWYIHLPTAGRAWKVELGFLGRSGRFYKILGSKVVKTPRKTVSTVIDETYRTLDEEFDEIFRLSGGELVAKGVQGFGGSAIPKGKKRKVSEEETERWSWPFPSSGGMWSGMPYSSGIPIRPAPKKDEFFFWVDCELILYGGTQPTAKVTVQGEPIKLRSDGTFSLRYSLPDGKITLPVIAVRADGKKKRSATPIVTRKTKR